MRDRGIFVIAIFKLVKAGLLLLVATGALSLLNNRILDALEIRIGTLAADPHYRFLKRVASFLGFNTLKHVEIIVIGSLFYAALFATEGVGLVMQKRWAEYLTAIVTSSFIPLEVYELLRGFGCMLHSTTLKSNWKQLRKKSGSIGLQWANGHSSNGTGCYTRKFSSELA